MYTHSNKPRQLSIYIQRAWLIAPLLVLVALTPLLAASAATAALVQDLNTQPYHPGFMLSTYELPAFIGATGFFGGGDSTTGVELWRSDGAPGGTSLVKDIQPGAGSSDPINLTSFDGQMFFSADDGSYGRELWRSDGTASGTLLVKDMVPATDSSYPKHLTIVGDTLFFEIVNGAMCELWKSDGTPDGTLLVRGGFPNYYETSNHLVCNLAGFTAAGQTLFFAAYTEEAGYELWKSDGTPAGTMLVADLASGSDGSFLEKLTPVGERVFFSRKFTGSPNTSELWVSDGSKDTTIRLAYFGDKTPSNLMPGGSGLSFVVDNELWQSDGTPAGTKRVIDLNSPFTLLAYLNGAWLYSPGLPGTTLWRTNGTAAGTSEIANLGGDLKQVLGIHNNSLLFESAKINPPLSITTTFWLSDGTQQGTRPFAFIPLSSIAIGKGSDALLIMGITYSHCPYALDYLNLVDETVFFVKNSAITQGSSSLANFTENSRYLFFTQPPITGDAFSPGSSNYTLWRSDGSANGTLALLTSASDIQQLTQFAGTLYAIEARDGGMLIRSSTPDGALRTGVSADWIAAAGSTLFLGNDSNFYRSDGTVEGTLLLTTIPFPSTDWLCSVRVVDGADLQGRLFFVTQQRCGPGHTGIYSYQLWRSDGTRESTVQIAAVSNFIHNPVNGPMFLPGVAELTPANDLLFFLAHDQPPFLQPFTYALWRSDGTPAGTFPLTNDAADVRDLAVLGDQVVFSRSDGASGRELWRSDGTAEGTMLVRDIVPGPASSAPAGLTTSDGLVFFSANDGVTGRELWVSDGTTAGTFLVQDIAPGPSGSLPSQLRAINGGLVFGASDGLTGTEPWYSDGSAAGTHLIRDIAPEGHNSNPAAFSVAGSRLFFTADDHIHGTELWQIDTFSSTIPASGGEIASWLDQTRSVFPAGAFANTTTVSHALRSSASIPPTAPLVTIHHAFQLDATDTTNGQLVQPAWPYTIEVQYSDQERGPVIEATLALYTWDGQQWMREQTSVVDPVNNTIHATADRLGLWAVLGETKRVYFPTIVR